MPVVIIYKISIISSLTVLSQSLFTNLSLDLLFLFSTYGPDLGGWPDCWVSVEFLRTPIPRKGLGSTTTTTTTTTSTRPRCRQCIFDVTQKHNLKRLLVIPECVARNQVWVQAVIQTSQHEAIPASKSY